MPLRRLLVLSATVLLLLVGVVGTGGVGGAADATGASRAPERTAPSVNWQQVDSGGEHSCARKTSGRLLCWGGNFYGVLGNGGSGADADRTAPVAVAGDVAQWATVSAGSVHTCAVSVDGHLFCWGDNFYGTLGIGAVTPPQPLPVEVDGSHDDWSAVSAGGDHTCGLRDSGHLFCWGLDFFGQLGDGPGGDGESPVPVEVAGGISDWAAVSAGHDHTCALEESGRLFCWGRNHHGQLGDDSAIDSDAPVEVAGSATDWVAVSAGVRHTCGLKASGQLFCWGSDSRGRLGNGGATTDDQLAPAEVAGAATDWAEVSAGVSVTCARKTSGRLYCWGSDADGRLGNGGANDDRARPVEVAGAVTGWRAVSVGSFHACALKATGRVFCWGRDRDGQLGNGEPRRYQDVPVAVT